MTRRPGKIKEVGTKTQKILGVVIAILMAVSIVGAANAEQRSVNQITIRSQDVIGQVLVESVTATEAGWLVLYKDPGLSTSAIVGWAPVHAGQNTSFTVDVNGKRIQNSNTLWARLHVDRDALGVFEWGQSGRPYNDIPVPNGPVVAFGVRTG